MSICRNMKINGRRTSLRMEGEMWEALYDVARLRSVKPDALVSEIENQRGESSTTAALRMYVLRYYRTALREWMEAESCGVSSADVKRLLECDSLPM